MTDGNMRLAALEEKRAARKAAAEAARDEQLWHDLSAIDEIEVALGDSNVAVLRLPYAKDLPAAVAVRVPTLAEMKRYRDRVRPAKDGRNRDVQPDQVKPAEEIGATCRVYPTDETLFGLLCDARPGLLVQMGVRALELGSAREETEGKG